MKKRRVKMNVRIGMLIIYSQPLTSYQTLMKTVKYQPRTGVGEAFRFDSLVTPGLDWTRIFISLTAGAGTR